jgi:hypothetical protein
MRGECLSLVDAGTDVNVAVAILSVGSAKTTTDATEGVDVVFIGVLVGDSIAIVSEDLFTGVVIAPSLLVVQPLKETAMVMVMKTRNRLLFIFCFPFVI